VLKAEVVIATCERRPRSKLIKWSGISKATARLMLCLLQGMRVVGKTGRSRGEMTAVDDAAMKLLG
jgi:TetR/AcrR family transcriptional regulator, transcriptional repressor for nem operon